jgi:hypothetical protein
MGSPEMSEDVLTTMDNLGPMWGMDDDGEVTPWATMDGDATSAVEHVVMGGIVAVIFITCGLLL